MEGEVYRIGGQVSVVLVYRRVMRYMRNTRLVKDPMFIARLSDAATTKSYERDYKTLLDVARPTFGETKHDCEVEFLVSCDYLVLQYQ